VCPESELTSHGSTIFFFNEVDDPIFCPITHLVSLAIADGAFEAPSLTTVERVFEHKVWGPVVSTPLSWEQEMLKTPIFRQDERTADVVTDQTKRWYVLFRWSLLINSEGGNGWRFQLCKLSYIFRCLFCEAVAQPELLLEKPL
jgi:hypothetical protein